jgi:hypothetical protein
MDHSGPLEELFLGPEHLRVVFAGGEFPDHGFESELHRFGHGDPIFTEMGVLSNRVQQGGDLFRIGAGVWSFYTEGG